MTNKRQSYDVRNYGQQPRSDAMQELLAGCVSKRELNEIVVVHHYTDVSSKLQLEIERRSDQFDICFERLII